MVALAVAHTKPRPTRPAKDGKKPNILVIFGDDIGQTNVSAYSMGLMGYRTPNIDRIAREGMIFTDYYAEQSCTAGRSSFITGQCTFRTGLSKVGVPASPVGLQKEDPTIAELLKPHGYATGQFGKNHLGDRNEYLPTVHGFDEFFGNLYHLNAEEEPEQRTYPRDPKFKEKFGPRGVLQLQGHGPGRPDRATRASAASASRRSRTPARSRRSGWRRSTTRRPTRPSITSSGRPTAGKPFFCWYNSTRMHAADARRGRAPQPAGPDRPDRVRRRHGRARRARRQAAQGARRRWGSPTTRSSSTRPTTART